MFFLFQLVEMVVDLCSGGSSKSSDEISESEFFTTIPEHHQCRISANLPSGGIFLNTPTPLQVGGLAHPTPNSKRYGWPVNIEGVPLLGCIRNIRVNSEVNFLTTYYLTLFC